MGLAGGVNQYGYVGGDPVNFSDPFGLWPLAACAANPVACLTTLVSVGSRAWGVARFVGRIFKAAQSANEEASQRTDDAVAGLDGEGEVSEGSRVRNVDRTGEGLSANDELDALADRLGEEVRTSRDGETRYVNLPDGGTASARPTSKSTGGPTVQVNRPGKKTTKIRHDRP
ncbi:MAG: hypothetical protein KF709_12690 [Gemmatimonadaceae bacterium]|nr:hypothetical protein [Gemmatimonadaceae bacterium]